MKRMLIALSVIANACSAFGALNVIAPETAAGVEGDSSVRPLESGRFQQVYSSSLFGSFPEGILISQMGFRVDGLAGHTFESFQTNVQIHLSTTFKAVDGLSAVYAENAGLDDRLVRGPDPFLLRCSGGGGVVGAWCVLFDIRNEPFFYNPSAGNLLLDIRAPDGGFSSPLDAVAVSGDSVSSVSIPFFLPGSDVSSGQPSTLGMATFFAFDPVPEPSAVALLAVGLVLGAYVLRSRKQNRKENHAAG